MNYIPNEAKVLIENLQLLLVTNFRKGLQDEKTQLRIVAENTTNLERVISVAIELELEQYDKMKNNQNYRNMNVVQNHGNRNFNFNQGSSQTLCMFCNMNNHLTSQCRQLRNFEQSQPRNEQFSSSRQRNFNSNQSNHNFSRNNSYLPTPNNNIDRPFSSGYNNYGRNYQQNHSYQRFQNQNSRRFNSNNYYNQSQFNNQRNYPIENAHDQNFPRQQRDSYERNNGSYLPNQQNPQARDSFTSQVQTIQSQISTQNNSVNNPPSLPSASSQENFSGNE